MESSSSSTSISLLPYSLSLISIPRKHVHDLGLALLEQIMQKSFVSVTMNDLELSLFIPSDQARVFQDAERRQRRMRGGEPAELIQISPDSWRVLQIDSHENQIGNSGARVRELSAPLAAAGISILYQSSYMSDFIFVKTARLGQVMSLLTQTGFDLYPGLSEPLDPYQSKASPKLSSVGSIQGDPSLLDLAAELGDSTVLTRTRSSTDASVRSLTSAVESLDWEALPAADTPQKPRANSEPRSPVPGEVRVLPTHLTCVGLRADDLDCVTLKVAKLLFFPSLFLPAKDESSKRTTAEAARGRRPASSSSSQSGSDFSDDEFFPTSPTTNASSLVPSKTPSSTDLLDIDDKSLPLETDPTQPPRPKMKHRSSTSSTGAHRREHKVPFFSLTRTTEGSSLTADASHLALLFEPPERHLVMCGGELDAADRRREGTSTPEDEEDDEQNMRTLQCLQIDLRRFGLDKYGLVSRFSRVLEENGINHMYSSTVKTANLLVGKRHASHAQALLSAC